ncbi:uncharacterized protein LOC120347280 [Styela clava]
MDGSFKKLEDILLKLKNVNEILEKETMQKCETSNRRKKRGKSSTKLMNKPPRNFNSQSKSINEQGSQIKSLSNATRGRTDTKSAKPQRSLKINSNRKSLTRKEKSNMRTFTNSKAPTAAVTRSADNHIILDFTTKPDWFQPTNKPIEYSKKRKNNSKSKNPSQNRILNNSKDQKNAIEQSKTKNRNGRHRKKDPPEPIFETTEESINFMPSFFSFHSFSDDKVFPQDMNQKMLSNDTDHEHNTHITGNTMVRTQNLKKVDLFSPLEALNVTGSSDISDKLVQIAEGKIKKEKENVNIKFQFSSDKMNMEEQNAVLASSAVNFLPQAKSENNANDFLSPRSMSNKETRNDADGEKMREKVALSSLTCSDNASSDSAIPRAGLAIETIPATSTSNDVLGKAQISEGSIFYDCTSFICDVGAYRKSRDNQNLSQAGKSFSFCIDANSLESNMTERRSEKFSRSNTTHIHRSSTSNENNSSLQSYKRRESTSPDEGIANSPGEMDESPTSSRKNILPDVAENNESRNHISINIEGGLQRETKSKKRSSRQHKSSSKRKHATSANGTNAVSNDKDRTVVRQEKHRETQRSDTSRDTKKKSHHQKPMRLSEKTVARKVVKSALIENSLARKNKPVWVEITKESTNGGKADPTGKRERDNQKQKDSTSTGATNGTKESRKMTEKEDNKTTKSTYYDGTNHKYSKRESRSKSSRQDRYANSKSTKDHSGKAKDSNGHLTKSDIKRVEAPRTLRHRHPEAEKSSGRSKKPTSDRRTSKSNKEASRQRPRSVSADSSVRDLSYSSSSSNSSSSSASYISSSGSHSDSSDSSYYSTSSVSASSDASSGSSVSSAQPSSLKKSGDYNESGARQTKAKKKIAKSDERQHGKLNNDYADSSTPVYVSKYKKAEKKSSKRTPSYDAGRKEYKILDLKPLQKATKEVEKTLGCDDDQEFEVNLERRRNRNRRRPVAIEEMVAKDPQKAQWQHHRLVTSQHPTTTTTVANPVDKTRQITDPPSGVKQKSFEASTKDSLGAVLTIRDLYSLHHVLSDTQNGTVIAGHRRSDGMRVAIKRIAKSGTTRWGWMNGKVVPLELALICQVNEVRHPGVVEIVEWHETTEAFLLVMVRPHPSVDLYDHVTKQKRLKEPVARRIIRQLVSALLHCHKMGVLHRDVKLENILFNPVTMDTILIDFGCGDYHRSGQYKEFAGTPEYYPPEWYLYKQYSGESATVWSIGVLLYSLLCGTLPFRSSKDIINKELTKYPTDVSRTAKHLIGQAVQKNYRDRPDLKGILSHPWFKSSSDHSGIRKKSV